MRGDNRDTDYLVSVVDPAWNEVVPTTYIIGRDGSVQTRIQGKKSLDEFKVAVTEVVNEPVLPKPWNETAIVRGGPPH